MFKSPFSVHPHQHFTFCLFDNSHSDESEVTSPCDFICISLMTSDVEYFMYFAICMSSFEKCLFSLLPISWLSCIFCYWVLCCWSSFAFWILCKDFLPFLGCLFFLLSVWWAEAFQFDAILICLFLSLFPVFWSAF
jgi:hypothetical protein